MWTLLKNFTDARVALGKSGVSVLTKTYLEFSYAHAQAKDAVWSSLSEDFINVLEKYYPEIDFLKLSTMAKSREQYLLRPDLGKMLDQDSLRALQQIPKSTKITIAIADGLSAAAIELNALPFLETFIPLIRNSGVDIHTIPVIHQGRVAVSDEIGELLGSELVVLLVGERPGLSASDSMGIYFTYNPTKGSTDEKRNCISNIRKKGLSPEMAAYKTAYLVSEALKNKIGGVALKDTFNPQIYLQMKKELLK
ncbi:MAG: ethanolamine ammonia-lyase subunit EutC [Cytophagales bacterium]